MGVDVQTGSPVTAEDLPDLARQGPVVVAVEPGAARRLLGDGVTAGSGGAPAERRRVALLDVGVERSRRDPYLIVDLDEAIFSTRPSAVVGGLAPCGRELVQLSGGMAPGEALDAAEARLESALDAAAPGWRERVDWRRRSGVWEATGAVDLPGTTWHDRAAVDRGDDVWIAGDWVRAPGHLAEVSLTSAVVAARGAVEAARAARAGAATSHPPDAGAPSHRSVTPAG